MALEPNTDTTELADSIGNAGTVPPSRTRVISVIIPVRNGVDLLSQCLEHLQSSHYQDFEVIVVDDASVEPVTDALLNTDLQVIRLDRQCGPAAARNRGAEAARGTYLVFLDADVCVHPETLGHLIATFENDPTVDAVFGSYDTRPAARNVVSQYRNLLHHFVHQTSHEQASTFWAGCGAVKRNVFLAFDGFNMDFSRPCIEDIEFGVRLHKAGHRIVLNKQAQVTHLKRWTLWNMVKTDLCDRGIPWTRLILKEQSLPNDLNLKWSQRCSALLSLALVGSLILTAAHPMALLALPLLALGIVLSNRRLYRFFRRERGWRFALRAFPLHVLYYLISSTAFAVGTYLYLTNRNREVKRVRNSHSELVTARQTSKT